MPAPTPSHRRTIADGRALITAWKTSGLTASAYCHANNLSRSRIDFWKRRIARIDRATGISPAFVQIATAVTADHQPPPAAPIMATLPNGVVLTVPPGSDLAWLAQVLPALLAVGRPC